MGSVHAIPYRGHITAGAMPFDMAHMCLPLAACMQMWSSKHTAHGAALEGLHALEEDVELEGSECEDGVSRSPPKGSPAKGDADTS